MEEEIGLMKNPSIDKILLNLFIVSVTILILGFAFNLYYAIGYSFLLFMNYIVIMRLLLPLLKINSDGNNNLCGKI